MRITLVISSLNPGGAERVLSVMANYWAEHRQQITIITLYDLPSFYPLHPEISLQPLGIASQSANIWTSAVHVAQRVRVLRRAIMQSDPDVVVSFMVRTNIYALAATVGTRVPVIVSERNNPAHVGLGRPGEILRRRFYSRAAGLVVQTTEVQRAHATSGIRKTWVIPNPVMPLCDARTALDVAQNERTLMAMGRLELQKGFDLLIRAFAQIAAKHSNWRLVIWGEGSERMRLEELASSLGMRRRIELPGITSHPSVEMQAASLFVLSSRYEGFPNVLCEAMSCGRPVIAFDCPFGPAQIIQHGYDGLLVPPEDVDSLALALDQLMSNGGERESLATRAPEILDRFGLESVMSKWTEAIREVIA